ncbi:RidA family protein [Streptomyces sp. AK010]|uniref:RidA family protein n=1 Tax=Streptomyces sp. AK010 TaxID=2723074 RepID=UPI00161EE858|nr:RidA family protein [Streptomyces sp. AK010]MBB6414973.1 enamine deaminase RidA (YjgF/YER057c/UK114 family) [Streptomyces sp. AK010]
MSELTRTPAPEGVAAAAQYSLPQALGFARAGGTPTVLCTGRFVAIAGQLAFDGRGRLVGEGDPAAQARQVFENLRRCPVAVGATFDDVVELTCFVTDMVHLPAVRAARGEHISDDRLPAASAVQVAAPVRPECLIEVEAFAVVAP